MDQKTLCDALRAARFSLFDREPHGAKNCAQANLNLDLLMERQA